MEVFLRSEMAETRARLSERSEAKSLKQFNTLAIAGTRGDHRRQNKKEMHAVAEQLDAVPQRVEGARGRVGVMASVDGEAERR